MIFEIVSTHSWNVLGTFEDEEAAATAVSSSLHDGGATAEDLVVYVSTDDGDPAGEFAHDELAYWASRWGAHEAVA